VFQRTSHSHAVSVFKPSSAMWRRASVLQSRKMAKFSWKERLTREESLLRFLGEGMMKGNSGDRCPPPGSLTLPSPFLRKIFLEIKVFSADVSHIDWR